MAKCVELRDRAARLYERAKEYEDLSNSIFKDSAGSVFAKVDLDKSDGICVTVIAKQPTLDREDINRFAKWLKDVQKYRWSR